MRFKKIKYTLIYNRQHRLNRDGTALIQIKAYQNAKSRYFSTEVWIEPKYWDQRNRKVMHTHPNQFVLNQQIRERLEAFEAFEVRMINRYGHCPLDRLDEFDKEGNILTNFSDFYAKELEESTIKKDSLKNQRTTFNKLKDFRSVVYFEDLNYNFVLSFDRYLRKLGLGLNTIEKHHKNLSKYIKLAINQDYIEYSQNPYLKFRPKGEEPTRIFLTIEELERIENLIFKGKEDHYERIRDLFLLSCWTGLRFSDFSVIYASNITETSKGLVLTIKAQKTGKTLQLPLYLLFRKQGQATSKAEKLIYKYLDALRNFSSHKSVLEKFPLFGKITNQYYNRSLKEIAKKAGIRKQLSSHAGRRTFATIMATKVKMPILQKLLQHSSLDMVKIYVQLSNKDIEDELENVNW